MGRYDDLRGRAELAKLTPLGPDGAAALRRRLPGVPADYVAFLSDVGFGGLGDDDFMLYGGPVAPSEIYDPQTASGFGDLVLFGDDFGGYCCGFDPVHGWAVVELDPTPGAVNVLAATFEEFIRGWLRDREAPDDAAGVP